MSLKTAAGIAVFFLLVICGLTYHFDHKIKQGEWWMSSYPVEVVEVRGDEVALMSEVAQNEFEVFTIKKDVFLATFKKLNKEDTEEVIKE